MRIAVPKEIREGEKRVALVPDIINKLTRLGYEVSIESGAGTHSQATDEDFKSAGASVVNGDVLKDADVVLSVSPLTPAQMSSLKKGALTISFLSPVTAVDSIDAAVSAGVTAFSLELVPRISRAQSMDALTSQALCAGYRAVLVGAEMSPRFFPLLMTAAGTVTPAQVLVLGAGVAGLQAIGTAKRLGAVVEVTDIRPETKEQVESLGGKFISFDLGNDVKTEGGYVKVAGEDVLKRQREILKKHLAVADCVITTALIPGRKAPVLITEDMVNVMKFGSVIVDMAVEQGGNCELSKADEVIERNGVKIVGLTNLAGMLPQNASEGYAKNIYNFLTHLATKEGMKWEREEEITKGTLICHQGEILRK